MSGSEPRIGVELDAPEPFIIAAGEDLCGTVLVTAPTRVRVHRVTLVVGWWTAGRGDVNHGAVLDETLLKGPWLEGDHEFSFRTPIPAAPLSYQGTLLKIRWSVRAVVNRVMSPDHEQRVEFRVA